MKTKIPTVTERRGTFDSVGEPLPTPSDLGVFAIDDNNKVVFWDEQCVAMFGWQTADVTDQNVSILFKAGLGTDPSQFFQRNARTQKSSLRVIARRKDGTEFPAMFTKTPPKDDSNFVWIAVFRAFDEKGRAVSNHVGDTQRFEAQLVSLASTEQQKAKPEAMPSVPAPVQLQALSADSEQLREKIRELEKDREVLQEQSSSYYFELEKVRGNLKDEREVRLQLEEKLKDVMSAGMQHVRQGLRGEPPKKTESQPHPPQTSDVAGSDVRALRERQSANEVALAEAERRARDGVTSLARTTTELEKERAERRRLEQRASSLTSQVETMHEQLRQHLELERDNQNKVLDLENQLRDRETKVDQLRADLDREKTDRKLAEDQLNATSEMSSQFKDALRVFEEAKQSFQRTEKDLASRLEASAKALTESQSRLQKEVSDRQQLTQTVKTLKQQLQEQSDKSAIEVSQLQSALQVAQADLKQMEGSAVHSRCASLEAARADRLLLNTMRTRMRDPLEQVLRSTRGLLEAELAPEHKKLVESVLEQALLLQSNIQEAPAGSSEPKDLAA